MVKDNTLRIKVICSCLSSVFLLFSLFFASPIRASNDGSRVIDSSEKQRVVENLNRLQKDINSITATVYQEKRLSLLKKGIYTKGTVTLQKPDMLRWETVSPEKSITVVDGETMTVYRPDLKEAEVNNLSEDFIARSSMSFFRSAMWGSLDEMEKRFKVNIFHQNSKIVFKLMPLSEIVTSYLSSIIIYYDENTGLIGGFEVTTPKGDKTITKLTNIRINPELNPETFKLNLPDDIRIINSFEPVDNEDDACCF